MTTKPINYALLVFIITMDVYGRIWPGPERLFNLIFLWFMYDWQDVALG